ncbi:MAG: hypothetical protein EZS28_046905 [Streblomastix strix]|uniref:Uncharacterized protein n=1 Tax=Streblomastix strix TaxID=222440 RepID=A0A5J4TH38_9EUKA|nr:MAG: hypothetical protein EZS28_046905 [Streblomastix strix]
MVQLDRDSQRKNSFNSGQSGVNINQQQQGRQGSGNNQIPLVQKIHIPMIAAFPITQLGAVLPIQKYIQYKQQFSSASSVMSSGSGYNLGIQAKGIQFQPIPANCNQRTELCIACLIKGQPSLSLLTHIETEIPGLIDVRCHMLHPSSAFIKYPETQPSQINIQTPTSIRFQQDISQIQETKNLLQNVQMRYIQIQAQGNVLQQQISKLQSQIQPTEQATPVTQRRLDAHISSHFLGIKTGKVLVNQTRY